MKIPYALMLLAAAAMPALATAGTGSREDPQQTTLKTVRAVPGTTTPFRGQAALQLLALETDLTARDVRLVLATETHNLPYAFRFQRDMGRQFAGALGQERFADLVAGLPIALHSPAVLEAARAMTAWASDSWARDDWRTVAVLTTP